MFLIPWPSPLDSEHQAARQQEVVHKLQWQSRNSQPNATTWTTRREGALSSSTTKSLTPPRAWGRGLGRMSMQKICTWFCQRWASTPPSKTTAKHTRWNRFWSKVIIMPIVFSLLVFPLFSSSGFLWVEKKKKKKERKSFIHQCVLIIVYTHALPVMLR